VKKLLAAAALALAATTASAEVTVKLGTLAPNGSTWHKLLQEMAERWKQASNGQVTLRIYPGGAQGSEGDMVRKMGVGQLQAASITTVGMHDIAKEPQALSAPGVVDTSADFEAVFPKLEKKLVAVLEERGYVPLQWSQVGPIRLFCSKPYKTIAEMSDAKMFAWDGDPASVEAWKAAGFRPVVLSSTDMVPSLQTGMINCLANAPLYVLTSRLFERAPNMIDTSWGYLFGATLVRKETWDKIPADLRPKLLEIAREIGRKGDADIKRQNVEAIAAMQKQGLTVVQVDQGEFRAAAEKAWPVVRGRVVPAAFFDEAVRARDEARKGGAASTPAEKAAPAAKPAPGAKPATATKK
jgi:TRAP-type C4-dicarboxylate transport system substrate-binding protein